MCLVGGVQSNPLLYDRAKDEAREPAVSLESEAKCTKIPKLFWLKCILLFFNSITPD